MRVSVDGLVERDVDTAREIVVLVGGVARSKALEHGLKVVQQQRLVLIDRDAERRMQRLQVDAASDEARAPHMLANLLRQIDELSPVRAFEPEAA